MANGEEASNGPLHGSALGLILFNIFLNDLGDGIECTHCKFGDDSRLGEDADVLEGRARIQ